MAKRLVDQLAPGSPEFILALVLGLTTCVWVLVVAGAVIVIGPALIAPDQGVPGTDPAPVAVSTRTPTSTPGPGTAASPVPTYSPTGAATGVPADAAKTPTAQPATPTSAPAEPGADASPTKPRPTSTRAVVGSPSAQDYLFQAGPAQVAAASSRTVAPPTPGPGAPAGTATTYLNVRAGPGTAYEVEGWLAAGQRVEITGRSPDGAWWQIRFPAATGGRAWISARYTTDRNTDNVPVVGPPDFSPTTEYQAATATAPAAPAEPTAPPAQSFPEWRGEYFANPDLGGAPALVRNDVTIDFNWPESPGPGVPADNFSARWTRSLHFPGHVYRFTMIVDDGARLWVDDQLVIDGWRSGAPDDFATEIGLSDGTHTLRLEYYEFRYGAQIYLNWEAAQDGPAWEGDYFDNNKLKGDEVLERKDGLINFNWGTGSPAPEVPADNFSVRWKQDVDFKEGNYIFNLWMDDGARLWVDDVLLIDSWERGRYRLRQASRYMSAGEHRVKVEYFEHTGHAQIEVGWDRQ